MGYQDAAQALEGLVEAYYYRRDAAATLACVTDDIVWVGTENNDSASGKQELAALLAADVEAFPESFAVELNEPVVQVLGEDAVVIIMTGKQVEVPGKVGGFSIRGTACCAKTEQGWLVRHVHTSVPNAAMEKFNLARQLDDTRLKEKMLMASIPGGVGIYRLKKGGRAVADYMSESMSALCGYRPGELGDTLHENAINCILPAYHEQLRRQLADCVASRKELHTKFEVYKKDGTTLMLCFDAKAMPDADLGPDDVGVLYGVQYPETDEYKLVAQEQKRYRMIFDLLGVAYWEWTAANGYYHSEKYEEYAISEMEPEKMWEGETPFDYVHPDDVPLMRAFMQRHPDDEVKKSAVVRCRLKDGSYRWTEMFSIAETDAAGGLVRIASVMRKVDREWIVQKEQLQIALKEAEAANRAKTQFLSRISHDMRTPLNGILGLTALLKERVTDAEITRDLSDLEMSGQYLLNLINDTLDIGKIESGKLELHPVLCDGRALFNNMLGLIKQQVQEKNIHLAIHAENIPFTTLYVDVSRIEQCMMNVLGNAVKFTPNGGSIDVTLRNIAVQSSIIVDEIIIKDTGIGMSAEYLPHIFEPFSQEDGTRTSTNQGSGLGMAITKQLLEKMGGSIAVQSEPGKGTTFTIVLKLAIATPEQAAQWREAQVEIKQSQNFAGRHVLLCEDHPLNTKIATRLLEAKQITVHHAENGQVALEMFEESKPGYYDLILMDIRMPVMDGIEATRQIRALPRRDAGSVPIVAMTANAFSTDREETKAAGMNAHLSKPIITEEFYRTLAMLLRVDRDIKRQKILVVDDVEVNRAVICATLNPDYEIIEAENGKKALEILQSQKGIDAVITDIQMPEMDGIELIRQIRANEAWRHLVIIANTQFGDPGQEEKLLALGANDFVYKPTTPKIVEIRVRNALHQI